MAELPAIMREQGRHTVGQLVITTNYDDAVERAFRWQVNRSTLSTTRAEPNEPVTFVHCGRTASASDRGHTEYTGSS